MNFTNANSFSELVDLAKKSGLIVNESMISYREDQGSGIFIDRALTFTGGDRIWLSATVSESNKPGKMVENLIDKAGAIKTLEQWVMLNNVIQKDKLDANFKVLQNLRRRYKTINLSYLDRKPEWDGQVKAALLIAGKDDFQDQDASSVQAESDTAVVAQESSELRSVLKAALKSAWTGAPFLKKGSFSEIEASDVTGVAKETARLESMFEALRLGNVPVGGFSGLMLISGEFAEEIARQLYSEEDMFNACYKPGDMIVLGRNGELRISLNRDNQFFKGEQLRGVIHRAVRCLDERNYEAERQLQSNQTPS